MKSYLKKKNAVCRVAVDLDQEDLDLLNQLKRIKNISRTEVIRKLIREAALKLTVGES